MTPVKIIVNVLDDDQSTLDVIRTEIEWQKEYQVEYFTKVSEFYKSLDKWVDLVISDVRLKQGVEVDEIIDTIKKNNLNCYIVIMSAYIDMTLAKRLNLLGIKFVEKNGAHWLDELQDQIDFLYPSLKHRSETKDLF